MSLLRYAQEAAYCERILAKSGLTILTATLPRAAAPTDWTHYPEGDVYDFESDAHWYYHSHASTGLAAASETGEGASEPDATAGLVATATATSPSMAAPTSALGPEHGHFHCFVRPDGKDGPIHHLIAISVDAMGRLVRLFTVGRHVVDDVDLPVEDRIGLLARFDVQLDAPNYLVNRWLTAVVGLYQEEITVLIREGAGRAARNPALDVTAQLETTLADKRLSLERVHADEDDGC